MIITEYYTTREDGVILDITYSDQNFYIIQDGTGVKYASAIDPRECKRTYTESEEEIPIEEGSDEEEVLEEE